MNQVYLLDAKGCYADGLEHVRLTVGNAWTVSATEVVLDINFPSSPSVPPPSLLQRVGFRVGSATSS